MAEPLETPILRTAVNKPGTVYDAENTKRMFAEDWNAAGDALDNHEERIVDLEESGGGGATNFVDLADVPSSYEDQAGKILVVNVGETALEFGAPFSLSKATGAELNTGEDDAKFATAKALADSDYAKTSDIPSVPVKATGAELNTGEDDAKFATAKALADSDYAKTSDIPSVPTKASGAEIDTGTDDAKFATAKALADQTVLLKKSGGTLTGEVGLGENAGFGLDNALSEDGKYSGISYAGTAGATLAFGDLCYKDPTDSRWELADSDVITAVDGDCRGSLGICVLAAANDGDATKMLLFGVVRAAAFPAFTKNAQLFVSGTAGDITETVPTGLDDAIRCVGYALSAEDLFFNPSMDYMTRIV